MAGVITALEVQKRNKERVNVYLDGAYAFSLALIEAAHLRRGQQLGDKEIGELQARDAVERAADIAVRFLAYRPRSIHEVRRHLASKNLDSAAIDAALARLEKLGYLDDLAFARFWVSNRDEFNPKGPLALRQELRQKGISNALIEQVVGEVDFAAAADRAARRYVQRLRHESRRHDVRRKLYQYLARRGFVSETIEDVIACLLDEIELPEPDDLDNDGFEE